MFDLNKLVRENVRSLVPYSCARDEFQGGEGIFMDANENPFGNLNRYPDPYQRELKDAISLAKGIPAEKIFLGNGSDEIIDLCYRVFCKPGIDRTIVFTPGYGMYEVSAAVNDVEVIKIPLNEDFQIDLKKVSPFLTDDSVKLIFICSPNNPTGNCINSSDIEYIVSNFSGIAVLDEAYKDFSENPSFIGMTDRYPNLIVLQTFSKAHGLAAVRVGMMFSDSRIIHYFNKMKPPYNVSTINQKAALQKLRRIKETDEQIRKIKSERERLRSNLQKIRIVEKIYPTDANFLLIKVNDAEKIYTALVERKIIVRNRDRLVRGCIRITVGTRNENNKLIKALKEIAK
jgi:histidinol-phosphate aminotransferase